MAKKVAEARLDITARDKSKTAFNSVQGRLKRMKDAMLSMKGVMVGTMVVGLRQSIRHFLLLERG